MPPITSQGSRTGLITAVVIFTILFVVATIFAIYYAVQAQTHLEEYTTLKSSIQDYLPEGAQTGGAPTPELKAVRDKGENGITSGMPYMNVAITQRNNLANLIDPSVPANASLDAAKAALGSAAQKVKAAGVSLPSNQNNLVGAVNAMTTAVLNKQQQNDQLQQQLTAAQKALEQKTADLTAAAQKLEETSQQIRGQAQQAEAGVTAYRSEKEQQVAGIQQSAGQTQAQLQEQITKLTNDLAAKQAEATKLSAAVVTLQNKLGERRVDAAESLIRHPDGQVIRIGAGDIVYVNLGSNQHIIPGLTFEIYDRRTGIPPLSAGTDKDDNDSAVQGKASIEIIRVDPNSSEARVISRTAGKPPISEGDYISNVVYDPNATYQFYVYGKFDLDHNNVATAGETDVAKRLIEQWGGKLATDINVNTDFVVIGAEPVVPNLTKEEESDPLLVQRRTQAQTDLNQYLDVINKARDLHIPILNQNRFLYFIGYYDQAKR